MEKTFVRPNKVRAEEAKEAARLFLHDLHIFVPPVPVKKIIKKIARLFYFPNNDQGFDFSKEEGFSYLREGTYFVYINTDLPIGRDSFTFAHEIGHIVLGHLKEFNMDELTDYEYWVLDREANIFAANLLMPEEWIYNIIKNKKENINVLTVHDIGLLKSIFGVSWKAMINRLDELGIQSKEKTDKIFYYWTQTSGIFYGFRTIENENPKEIIKCEITIETEEETELSHNKLRMSLDENMRFVACPRCGNTVFSKEASYCKMCGLYLFNECTNPVCKMKNVIDARYCEYCGSLTTLFQENILKPVNNASLFLMLEELLSENVETEFDSEGNIIAIKKVHKENQESPNKEEEFSDPDNLPEDISLFEPPF